METQKPDQDFMRNLYPFEKVNDINHILPILKARLPISSNVYNMAILSKGHIQEDTLFYTFAPKEDIKNFDSVWIVAAYHRCDLGKRYSISVPSVMVITQEVKDAFINSSVINWDQPYSFVSLERRVSPLIIEISAFRLGTNINIIPTKIYTCDPSEVMNRDAEIICEDPNRELKLNGLKSEEGALFLSQNWKYSTVRTYDAVKKLLGERESIGLYLNGQLVSGVLINDSGVIGLLHTLKEQRGNGYARLVMTNLMKKIVLKGAYPCSCVEIKNYSSMAFHEKLGMKFSFFADYIATRGYE